MSIENLIVEINRMEKNELDQVREIVHARYDFLSKMAALSFKKDDRVQFETKHGRIVVGTVEKVNKKTVNIKSDDGPKWRVAPEFLEKI